MSDFAYQLLLAAPGGGSGRDVTQLVQSMSWSGSIRQTARQLSVHLAIPRDGSVDPPSLEEGAGLIFRHAARVHIRTPESFPWSLDGEYAPGMEEVEIVNQMRRLTFLL